MADESNVLFLRRNGNENENEDLWDDTALIQAYDKAVNLAKEEVAKRIAMDTQDQQARYKSQNKCSSHTIKPLKKWTIGAPCRAIYSVDGEVYEAIISKIHQNSGMCTVKFVGYQNTEKVELSSLLESEGLQSQIAQHKEAVAQKANEEVIDSDTSTYSNLQNSKQINGERMDCDTENPEPSNFRSKYENNLPGSEYFTTKIDGIPPAPPLPPQFLAKLPESDADALSSMLMSWYISGFHTGYYHGLKQAKINQQKRRNCQ
ncbi:survival motor neuron protein isoform X1 [Pogonomyrmex barbatus]|uniref:Survival motor neuron protein isoform X1 n=2 Tax=Pogonomyrmex barbatus TaxID=144034 RepID=A0A6I9WRL3_9HYME|nr:survival motor neuron protein isoform X1 [Pogonomyrmex barbatus]